MYRETHIALIENDISVNARQIAEQIYDKGYRKQMLGQWQKDLTYTGKNKTVFRCSLCDHWFKANRKDLAKFYMRYCPQCGAYMSFSEEDKQ